MRQNNSKTILNREMHRQHNHSSLTTYKRPEGNPGILGNIEREREKIEHIIRSNKEEKRRSGNDTIANKLRKLFIHKVILPREKLLEEEKSKYVQTKTNSSRLVIKLI